MGAFGEFLEEQLEPMETRHHRCGTLFSGHPEARHETRYVLF
jgi:hypothetical protein